MRFRSGAILALAVGLAACSSAADVRLPTPPAPAPAPSPPIPSGVYVLEADDRYPVNADSPTLVRAYPPGLIEFKSVKAGTHHWESGGQEKSFEAGPNAMLGKAVGRGRVEVEFFWAEKENVKTRKVLIDCQGARPPPTPPDPKPPEPKPPEPVPATFRVIFIYETADLLTPAQKGVIFGLSVETWLNANCTDGKAGWRRRDKDGTGGKDTEILNKIWAAAQPKVTVTPCVAVARVVGDTHKVDIIPLEATQVQMIAKFNEYRTGGK